MACKLSSALDTTELKAQRHAAFKEAASNIGIPAILDSFNHDLMDGPIIFSLACQLKGLLRPLD